MLKSFKWLFHNSIMYHVKSLSKLKQIKTLKLLPTFFSLGKLSLMLVERMRGVEEKEIKYHNI